MLFVFGASWLVVVCNWCGKGLEWTAVGPTWWTRRRFLMHRQSVVAGSPGCKENRECLRHMCVCIV